MATQQDLCNLKTRKRVLKTKITKSRNKIEQLLSRNADYSQVKEEFIDFNHAHSDLRTVFQSIQMCIAEDQDGLEASIDEESDVRSAYALIKKQVKRFLKNYDTDSDTSLDSIYSSSTRRSTRSKNTVIGQQAKIDTPQPLFQTSSIESSFKGFSNNPITDEQSNVHTPVDNLINLFADLGTPNHIQNRHNNNSNNVEAAHCETSTPLYMTPMGEFIVADTRCKPNPVRMNQTFVEEPRTLNINECTDNLNIRQQISQQNFSVIHNPFARVVENSNSLPVNHSSINQHMQQAVTTQSRNVIPNIQTQVLEQPIPVQPQVHVPVLPQSDMFQHQPTIPFYNDYQRPKLPPLSFSPFDGSYEKWETFRDTYVAMIHNSPSMPAVEKFHRLKGLLVGTATSFVINIPVTEANYFEVWSELCEYYDSPRRIAVSHIQGILNIEPASSSSPQEMRFVVDSFKSHLRALKSAGLHNNAEILQIQLLLAKMDSETRQKWESKTSAMKEIPTLKTLYEVIEKRIRSKEVCSMTLIQSSNDQVSRKRSGTEFKKINKPVQYANLKKTDSMKSYSDYWTCKMCNENHSIYKCRQYLSMSAADRWNVIKEKNLCFNCLQEGHNVKSGKCQGRCRIENCNEAHHTTLHDAIQNTTNQRLVSNLSFSNSSEIMLATIVVVVHDSNGQPHKVRALLDGGGQCNFISNDLCKKLNLQTYKESIEISAVSNLSTTVQQATLVSITSFRSNYSIDVSCAIMEQVTEKLPQQKLDISNYDLPTTIQLADPTFCIPGKIDMLLSAAVFFHSLSDGIINLGEDKPRLFNSKFGWLVAGGGLNKTINPKLTVNHVISMQQINKQIEQFWAIENFPSNIKFRTIEDELCEQHFTNNYIRANGKFIVRLPFKDGVEKLSENNREKAEACSKATEKKFQKDDKLLPLYTDFMQTYLKLGHMKLANSFEEIKYFIPHHHVFKKGAGVEKFRVVFNASSKTKQGISLNDILHIGNKVQDDLTAIVLRFRFPVVPLVGDIEKMYRQIMVDELDQSYQGIIWRENPQLPLQAYKLCTLTYGTSPAAFLATRCIKEIVKLDGEKFPFAAQVIDKDFYMDDLLTGASSIEEAIQLRQEIQEMLNNSGMPIRKWLTNSEEVLQSIPEELRADNAEVNLSKDEAVKTLGMLWRPKSDEFQFTITDFNEHISKRTVLSDISKLFDPLGLIGPVTFEMKFFMQQMWKHNLSWDEDLPSNLKNKWLELKSSMNAVSNIHINRRIIPFSNPIQMQYFGFADASEKGYGACIYLASKNEMGEIQSNLVCSKSRIAPLKTQSIPRLELCGALLLAELLNTVKETLNLPINEINCFSDSKIVLSWLSKEASKWKVFVANRISKIHEVIPSENWHHISTKLNPADVLSRGCNPDILKQDRTWWHGPEEIIVQFMNREHITSDTELTQEESIVVQEEERIVVHMTVTQIPDFTDLLYEKHNDLQKIIRIVAFVKKFIKILQEKHVATEMIGKLTFLEITQAEYTLVKKAQMKHYANEYQLLMNDGQVPHNSKILSLNPFMDKELMLIRVGGRVADSCLPYNRKHPIILPQDSAFTQRLFTMQHKNLLHAGPQTLLNHIRNKYWPVNGKRIASQTYHSCVTCVKFKPKLLKQIMGNIPSVRLTPTKPFLNCCIDYAGPIKTKQHEGPRCKIIRNSYICIFVCCSTRAVHIEPVTDLSTSAFIAALKRFVSRRGKVLNIYSDNGSNFIGAKNEFQRLLKMHETDNALQHEFEHITWHFIPANSPHMGGLHESNIKSMKSHLFKVIGTNMPNFEKFCTILTQVEACLNSRPICVLPSAPEEILTLTPGHFLTGGSLMAIPDYDYTNLKLNRLDQWCAIQRIVQDFWKIWQRTYIDSLQSRYKWKEQCENLQIDDIVLVQDENLKPMFWKLGRITRLFPDCLGQVRAVELLINGHLTRRTIHKLCKLPTSDN